MKKEEALKMARKAIMIYEARNQVGDALLWTAIIEAIK